MDKIFWMIPGKVAGRSGPDQDPWDLETLRRGGIGAILSVNDGRACVPEEFAAAGMDYACIPLSANAPPLPGDEEICASALQRAYEFVGAQLAQERRALVHCSAGKDRTGLFLCYFLMRHEGLSPDEAIRAVRRVRPIALTAEGWEDLARQVLPGLGR